MQFGLRLGVAITCAATFVGCANVKVKKVSVSDRLSGHDAHVRGFRYYMNRPYVVVAQQVPLATSYVAVKPFYMKTAANSPKKAALASLSPDPRTGKHLVYDRDGNEMQGVEYRAEYDVTPVAPVGASVPGDNSSPLGPLPIPVLPAPATTKGANHPGTSRGAVATNSKVDGDVTVTMQSSGTAGTASKLDPQHFVENNNPSGGFGGAPASSSVTTTSSLGSGDDPNAGNGIQVVFLPDFEEQYAIRNKNFLAKTQYKYNFAHGTQLDTMAGTYSSVDVPVKILDTIGNLITAAGALSAQRISNPPAKAAAAGLGTGAADILPQFYIKRQDFIEPGFYRLQKSWEQARAASQGQVAPEIAMGLFSDMGLVVQSVSSVITKTQYGTEHPATP